MSPEGQLRNCGLCDLVSLRRSLSTARPGLSTLSAKKSSPADPAARQRARLAACLPTAQGIRPRSGLRDGPGRSAIPEPARASQARLTCYGPTHAVDPAIRRQLKTLVSYLPTEFLPCGRLGRIGVRRRPRVCEDRAGDGGRPLDVSVPRRPRVREMLGVIGGRRDIVVRLGGCAVRQPTQSRFHGIGPEVIPDRRPIGPADRERHPRFLIFAQTHDFPFLKKARADVPGPPKEI